MHVYLNNIFPCAYNFWPMWPWPWTWGQRSGFEICDHNSQKAHSYCVRSDIAFIFGMHVYLDNTFTCTLNCWTWGPRSGFEICNCGSKKAHNICVPSEIAFIFGTHLYLDKTFPCAYKICTPVTLTLNLGSTLRLQKSIMWLSPPSFRPGQYLLLHCYH